MLAAGPSQPRRRDRPWVTGIRQVLAEKR